MEWAGKFWGPSLVECSCQQGRSLARTSTELCPHGPSLSRSATRPRSVARSLESRPGWVTLGLSLSGASSHHLQVVPIHSEPTSLLVPGSLEHYATISQLLRRNLCIPLTVLGISSSQGREMGSQLPFVNSKPLLPALLHHQGLRTAIGQESQREMHQLSMSPIEAVWL